MPHVITRKWDRWHDPKTGVEFAPVLDVASGCYVGAAEVEPEVAREYSERAGFEVLDNAGFMALITQHPD